MAGVNFSGLASGLDTDLIIQSLLINRQSRVNSINDRIDQEAAKKRALNDVKTSLNSFQDIVGDFTDEVFQNRSVTSSDESLVTATADGTSALGENELEITNLATRSVVSIGAAQNSATATVGAGTLTLNNDGGESFAVTLSDGASTLTDLREAINDQHGDSLQASIIEVTSGSFQLVVSSKDTGAAINIKNDAAATDPSSFSGFDAGFTAGGIDTEQTAIDANFSINGIDIVRASNEIDDVLEGVTLNLQKGEPGTKIKLEVSTDLDEITSQFEELAKGFNDIISQIDRVTNRETGVLSADNDLIGLKRTLQSQITRFIPNSDNVNIRDDGTIGFTSLSQLGFETDRKDGTLSVDTSVLTEALEDHFDEVKNLFQGSFTTSNANVQLTSNRGSFSGEITLDTATDIATIDAQNYNLTNSSGVLTFPSSSDYSGLILTSGTTSDNAVSIQVTAGLGAILDDEIERFSGFSGILNDRTSTIDTRTRSLDKELGRAEDRLESERTRLTAIFANAEQAISSLQALQSSLGAQTIGGFNV